MQRRLSKRDRRAALAAPVLYTQPDELRGELFQANDSARQAGAAVILSGFATPIANMPPISQDLTLLNPRRYFPLVARGLFLEALPAQLIHARLWPIAAIAAATLSGATWLFRRRLG